MADSWEDQQPAEAPPQAPAPPLKPFSFNPSASSFAFNPTASSWAPPPPKPSATLLGNAAVSSSPAPPAPIVSAPVAQETSSTTKSAESSPMEIDQPSPSAPPSSPAPPAIAVCALVEKVEELKVKEPKEPKEPAVVIEEPTVDESAIMKAYDALMAEDGRDHLNVVFIGHIDAGKSTLAGQILFLTGGVDKRTIEKYEKEAKEKNREGWYMAYIMDTNEEERTKGITVEVGRAHFQTEKKRYTILDAPGHKNYVPNMIQGACQADVAILLISARKGEFETGFERGGQTREHAQLAKTLGVARLIVVVNKLDCPSVCLPGEPNGRWDKARFDNIVNGMTPFLKGCGYNMKKEVTFLPVAALYGHNIKEAVTKGHCDWYEGGSLFETLDAIDPVERNPLAPVRLPIVDRWKEMGTILMGKIEAGFMRVGDVYQLMPNKLKVKIEAIFRDEEEVKATRSGENLRLKIAGAEETDILPGFVLSSIKNPVPIVTQFECQLMIIELLEHNPVFTVGYKAMVHIHTACEECEVIKLLYEVDPKTKEQKKAKFVKQGQVCICRIQVAQAICIEEFQNVPALGRFTLRDEGRTIAIGKVSKLPKGGPGLQS